MAVDWKPPQIAHWLMTKTARFKDPFVFAPHEFNQKRRQPL